MDLTSPIGIVVCFGLIVGGILILGGNVMDFIDPASILLTVVPTFGALFIAFPLESILKTLKHFPIILGMQKYDPLEYMSQITSMAEVARVQGLIALESQAGDIKDEYVKSAAMMVADGTEPEMIETRLYGILDAMTERHAHAWSFYDKGASFGPAFGMLSTVVSLVNMLKNLDFAEAGGIAQLGINMSAALITTFYGSILANVFFLPLGNKLRVRHQAELACKKLIIEGFLAIQKGMNPRVIKDMLVERLDPKIAAKLSDSQ